ncbi:MAG TPA: thiazole synthase, partial [Psychrobacter sp.]|nr:thiazole synthase [Psychrobacter sp.]
MGGYDKSIIECTFSSHLKVTGMTMQTVTEEN